jgi:GTP-binding protein EngB required for normal cell division
MPELKTMNENTPRGQRQSPKILVALAGNPNVGKSTVFNALAREHQHTGNWPGKTVEKAEGWLCHRGRDIVVIDLPGTYSLSAHSPEEVIARDFVIRERPGVVIDIVDGTLLERNLNLTLQILEVTEGVVVAVNFMDEVRRAGLTIDVPALERSRRTRGTNRCTRWRRHRRADRQSTSCCRREGEYAPDSGGLRYHPRACCPSDREGDPCYWHHWQI